MRRTRVASEALRLATEPSRQPYVCRSCMVQAARHFHTTSQRDAEVPVYRRMRETIFGKKTPEKKREKQVDAEASGEEKSPEKNREEQVDAEASGEEKSPEELHEEYLQRNTVIQDGVEYEVAKRVDPAKMKDYLQAMTWDGLERVGSRKWAKARADQGEKYEGFVSRKGADVDKKEDIVRLEQRVLEIFHREMPSETEQRDLTKIDIQNPELKLAIVREIIQFTGKRVPDLIISKARTANDLFRAVQAKEPPKKLKDDPRVQELGASEDLPNVRVYATKRTPVHKETEIGRWKVIEDELKLRGLPVFGTNYPHAKEGIRLHEKKVDWRKHGFVKHTARK
ncbi:hypothetical protein AC579_9208 [Pseudocercospora musae]|uniref:Large ribosomal subunit protein mL50 n=1 Tax=Pseudocercospora musae TaxID=113226 RepID=A0A139I089_9PEZI|nr:hypothetical protein AC579_9208 [Pseudocercospora musae]